MYREPVAARVAIAAGLVALVAAAYSGVLVCEFTSYDDDLYVTNNALVLGGLTGSSALAALSSFHAGNWHPLTWWSHMLDVSLFGLSPAGHHAMSAALHALNAVLAFVALEALTGSRWRSAFAAALFALHPLRVESVAWVAERKDVLSACLGLAALWVWVGWARGGRRASWLGALALFALALMAKPMLVTLPFLLLVLDFWPLQRLDSRRALGPLVREKLAFFALAAAGCTVTLFAQQAAMTPLPLGLRFANTLIAYRDYLRRAVAPYGLAAPYPYPASYDWTEIAGALLVVVALSALALQQARRRPWLLTGWLWFAGMLVPTLGLVQVGVQASADRYTYLPFLGLAVAGSWSLGELAERVRFGRALASLGALLALAACLVATRAQVGVWHDTVSLFENAIAVTRNNDFAHTELGIALRARGELARARAELERAVELRPLYARALGNLGMALADTGEPERGLELIDRALAIEPKLMHGPLARGLALEKAHRYAEAEAEYRRALAQDPRERVAAFQLARLLSVLPDPELRDGAEALALCERACAQTSCDTPELLDLCGMAAMEAGRKDLALERARRAAQLARARGDAAFAARIEARAAGYERDQPMRWRVVPRGADGAR